MVQLLLGLGAFSERFGHSVTALLLLYAAQS
jgi:hypothetical protein